MRIDWEKYTTKDLDELIESWYTEIDLNDCSVRVYREIIENIHEYADDQFMWHFIHRGMILAANDGDLEQLAAGPTYFFIELHGDHWIDRIELAARRNPTFAKLLTGVWKANLSEFIWLRIEAIQCNVSDPLPW
jgi:hypothetical protein